MKSGPRLRGFRLACCDVAATAAFYERAFDFSPFSATAIDGVLSLADGTIELVHAAHPSLPAASNETSFQHLALVVPDMAKALQRLEELQGWMPISRAGPQTLPEASGGVTAFKFRDPEGHPLEFLAFPRDRCPQIWRHHARSACPVLGVDHSAITVADVERSIAFYEALGFCLNGKQVNTGIEQDRLDNVDGAVVDVVALSTRRDLLHLELLHYRAPPTKSVGTSDDGNLATAIVLAKRAAEAHTKILDPDDHRIVFGRSSQ